MAFDPSPPNSPADGAGLDLAGARRARIVLAIAATGSFGLLASFLGFLLFGWIFWSAAGGLIDAEIPPGEARPELASRLERSFGVELADDWEILRARDMRAKFRSDGYKWFLVQLPTGRGPAFEAELVAAGRTVDREPRHPIVVTKPKRGEDGDDWSKSLRADAKVWHGRDDYHDWVAVRGDRFYFYLVVP